MGDWPTAVQIACRERCAEMGEPPCFEVDTWPEAQDDPSRGLICGECRKEANYKKAKSFVQKVHKTSVNDREVSRG